MDPSRSKLNETDSSETFPLPPPPVPEGLLGLDALPIAMPAPIPAAAVRTNANTDSVELSPPSGPDAGQVLLDGAVTPSGWNVPPTAPTASSAVRLATCSDAWGPIPRLRRTNTLRAAAAARIATGRNGFSDTSRPRLCLIFYPVGSNRPGNGNPV